MKKLATFAMAFALIGVSASGQVIIADDFNVTASGTGFGLGSGANSGIIPPATRLTGSAADNLRYMNRAAKPDAAYLIGGNARLRVNNDTGNGRTTLSADGTNPFDFSFALGIAAATPANPVEYDITLSMDNNASGTTRMSFGIGTIESDANNWDFGLQLYKAIATDTFYTVGKRIDSGSSGLADQNAAIFSMAANSAATEVSFLIRVTDAGAESSSFNSRVRVSQDGGATWFYDTLADGSLTSGWRLDGPGRFFSFDIAGGNSSFVTYDNFSVTVITPAVPEPSVAALGFLAGIGVLAWRRRKS